MGTGGREHGLLIRAVLSGVVGVLFGMLPYFAAAQIMLGLLEGRPGDTLVTQKSIYRNFVIERTVSDRWTLRESEMGRDQARQMKRCTHFCVHRFSCILCFRGAALFLSLA